MWYVYGYVALGLFTYGTFIEEDGMGNGDIGAGIFWPVCLPIRLGAMLRLSLGRKP